jgi:hypothetical protein
MKKCIYLKKLEKKCNSNNLSLVGYYFLTIYIIFVFHP